MFEGVLVSEHQVKKRVTVIQKTSRYTRQKWSKSGTKWQLMEAFCVAVAVASLARPDHAPHSEFVPLVSLVPLVPLVSLVSKPGGNRDNSDRRYKRRIRP